MRSKAKLLIGTKFVLENGALIEIRVWQLREPVPPATHKFKYRMVYVEDGERLVGYDNERGKGDHKHFRGVEASYVFRSIEQLLADFRSDIETVRGSRI